MKTCENCPAGMQNKTNQPEMNITAATGVFEKVLPWVRWIIVGLCAYAILWGDARWIKREEAEGRFSKVESKLDTALEVQKNRTNEVREDLAALKASIAEQNRLLQRLVDRQFSVGMQGSANSHEERRN